LFQPRQNVHLIVLKKVTDLLIKLGTAAIRKDKTYKGNGKMPFISAYRTIAEELNLDLKR